MECMLDDDSPLARVLLEGAGLGLATELRDGYNSSEDENNQAPQFAPANTLQSRLRHRLGQPLRIDVPNHGYGPVAKMQQVCSGAVSSSLRHRDNERFLEQFRYIIIASGLQSEQSGRTSYHPSMPVLEQQAMAQDQSMNASSVEGAVLAIGIPAILSGLISWLLTANTTSQKTTRCSIVLVFLVAGALVITAYIRRQTLLAIRQKACRNASALITNLQALDQSTSAALTLVREIELVSRGYRLHANTPPPISLIEDTTKSAPQSRRCSRLRRTLCRLYTTLIPLMITRCNDLQSSVSQDHLEKYLDINEIADPDVQEAFSGALISEIDDQESLSALRAMSWRLITLRRIYLCYLLALPANGSSSDSIPWRTAVSDMEFLAAQSGTWSETLNSLLREDDTLITPSTPTATTRHHTPEHDRIRTQLRKTNHLSAELRAIQAKLHILRDDVSRILDGEANIHAVQPLFTSQADSIATDLRLLNSTFDNWKHSLLPNPSSDRRRSRPSSELRSPISLGGLTVVDEDSASPSGPNEALKALTGDFSDVEEQQVFEALAMPRHRVVLTREEKIAKMADEEAKRAVAKEMRMQSTNLVRELESVINTRFSKRMSTGRMTLGSGSRISSI